MFKKPLKEVIEKNCESILSYEGVQAIGEGEGFKDGKPKGECLVFFVEKKKPLYTLQKAEVLPKKYKGYKTDVIEVGEIRTMNLHRSRTRPAKMGGSCAHFKVSACTAGAKVFRGDQAFILSNAHCVFPHYIGAKKGDEVLQPSPADGGRNPQDIIGTAEEVVELKLLEHNLVDAALVKVNNNDVLSEQIGLGQMGTEITRAKVGDIVVKSSRTSGVGTGRVIAVNVIAKVRFDWIKDGQKNREIITFKDQVFLSQNPVFVRGGDSGSLVFLESTKQPVGLIFAASDQVGVMNNFDNVASLLRITLEEPRIGFIAVDTRWLVINETNITTRRSVNLRSEPTTTAEIIKVLPRGTRLRVLETAGVSDNHFWIKTT